MISKNIFNFISFSLLFVPFTFAQSLDEDFLKSLPDDIASDLTKRSQEQEAMEEVQYRRPSTFIKKPEPTSERFGAKVFSMMQSTLMPINEPNYDSSYVLDFGDELELQLVGEKSSLKKMRIRSDGSINIEEIGKVFVAGLPLSEATNLVKAKINKSFIGVDAYLTLINIRNIQVLVVGNVYNPGPYTLNGNSNVFHALSVSGGPSELGSFRSINIIRNNKIVETTDLYEIFINGISNSLNKRLKSGDMIFVNPVNKIVSINGAVKRPGEYELIDNESASTILRYANGLNAFADIFEMKLERVIDGKIKQIPIVSIDDFPKIIPKDADNIFIRAYPFRKIEVRGAVKNPGIYLMNEGDNMFDAIKKAGGYTENAYPFGGIYESREAREVYEMAAEELYQDFLDNLIEMSQADLTQEVPVSEDSLELTEELKETEITGRVIADFLDEDQSSPILVKDGDMIIIPEVTSQVYVYGEVASEGAALFAPNSDVINYIERKGGLKNTADKRSIYILHPNGESELLKANRNIFASNETRNLQIYPGSVIFVPRKIDTGYSARMRAQAYATIIGNLGVSLASLSVLKD